MLREKIKNKTAKYGVLGLGYVGLPLAVEFAKAGFHVTGFEVDARKVESIGRGVSYIDDVPTEEVAALVKKGLFSATTDFDRLAEVDIISICVPTPLGKTRDPDLSFVVQATEACAKRLRKGQLIILESTTYPGTTDEVCKPMLEQSRLTCGRDFYLAFSPERVDPANKKFGVKNTPKVVGGCDRESGELASMFYGCGIDRIVPVSSASAAEMAKLLENTFRAVNIALVNEMALMCDRLNLDVWEVIDAAATKPFGFMKFVPGPGVGGHCIPLDPIYLSWKMRALNYRARMIELAADINLEMPGYVVRKVGDALNDVRKSVRGSRLLVLGVAYKNDVDDMRESPALDVIRLLEERGADVVYHDPHVPEFHTHDERNRYYKSVPLSDEELRKADCVVITTKHSIVDHERVARMASLVVDARNALPRTVPPPVHAGRVVRI